MYFTQVVREGVFGMLCVSLRRFGVRRWCTRLRLFLGGHSQKRFRIQRYLVRQWKRVCISLRGRRSSTGLCFATETGTHSANCAFSSNKVEFVPVVIHDRRLVQTVLKPVEVPQVQFAGDGAVLALFFGCRQALLALIADHGGFFSWFHW